MHHQARRCTAQRKDGRPCRSWATRDSDEALCARHQPRQAEAGALGFYQSAYSVEEAANLIDATQNRDLEDELNVTRIAVRHALSRLGQDLKPAEFAQLLTLIFKGAHTIAGIIRVQRSISGDEDDLIRPEIRAALDEISAEKDYDL